MKIKNSKFVKSLVYLKDKPDIKLPEIACVGRSNVGKSSLINSLLNRKKLVQVSKSPGKTKLINYFEINKNFYIVDLPGYGFAKVSHSEKNLWKKMIENYLLKSSDLKLVLTLTDVRHGPQKSDLALIEWLEHKKIPFYVIATKTDKLSKTKLQNNLNKFYRKHQIIKNRFLPYSSVTKQGREELLQIIGEVLSVHLLPDE